MAFMDLVEFRITAKH